MKDALARFGTWAKAHAGEACPDAAALGEIKDPWGHAFAITCTDQPGDQIIGLVSAGPDGIAGNGDDIATWQLGHDVTDLVHGARWTVAVAKPVPTKPVPARPKPQHPAGGVQLDENGLPISR